MQNACREGDYATAAGIQQRQVDHPEADEAGPGKQPHHQEPGEEHPAHGLRVLLELEDDMQVIGEAENGKKAIDRYGELKPDVVLMDINMPEMDGVAATRRIRDFETDIKQPYIIAVTAHAMEGDRERYLAAGMDNYVSKPVLAPRLISALKEAAQVARTQRELQVG